MSTVFFPSSDSAEVVEVRFATTSGGVESRRLLVDSGFTGQSDFVLSARDVALNCGDLPSGAAVGALVGPQDRAYGVPSMFDSLGVRVPCTV